MLTTNLSVKNVILHQSIYYQKVVCDNQESFQDGGFILIFPTRSLRGFGLYHLISSQSKNSGTPTKPLCVWEEKERLGSTQWLRGWGSGTLLMAPLKCSDNTIPQLSELTYHEQNEM